MTPEQIADALLAGESPRCGEAEMTAACDVLRERLTAAGLPVPATEHAFEHGPLVEALKGSSTETPEDDSTTVSRLNQELTRTRAELTQAKASADRLQGDLERERADHAAAKAEVQKLTGTIAKMTVDHEAALKQAQDSVHREAASLIVKYGIREPNKADAAINDPSLSVTERCRKAAAEKP